MAKHAPGKHFRNGLSILEVTRMFPNDEAAEKWTAQCRLGDTPACPNCESENVQTGAKHPSQHYHCREKDAPRRSSKVSCTKPLATVQPSTRTKRANTGA
jgi:hypothetical protein